MPNFFSFLATWGRSPLNHVRSFAAWDSPLQRAGPPRSCCGSSVGSCTGWRHLWGLTCGGWPPLCPRDPWDPTAATPVSAPSPLVGMAERDGRRALCEPRRPFVILERFWRGSRCLDWQFPAPKKPMPNPAIKRGFFL